MDRWVEVVLSWSRRTGQVASVASGSQYGVRSKVKGHRADHDVGDVRVLSLLTLSLIFHLLPPDLFRSEMAQRA